MAASPDGLPLDVGWRFTGYRCADFSGVGFLHRPGEAVSLRPETEERVVAIEIPECAVVGTYVEHQGGVHGTDADGWWARID